VKTTQKPDEVGPHQQASSMYNYSDNTLSKQL
jgi:hypothetical protein